MAPRTQITSTQNARFKAARALRDARERRTRNLLLVDGSREIDRALQSGVKPVEAWLAPERLRSERAQADMMALHAAGAEIVETTPEILGKLAYGERDDGLVAVMEAPATGLERLTFGSEPFIAVVDRVEKPGNLGALLRSADGAGLDAVIVSDPVSDLWNPNAIRASLGTIFRLPVALSTAAETLDLLRRLRVRIVTARVEAATGYDEVDLTGGLAIVVGNEEFGLGDAWSGPDITAVHIPMLGIADSLNVSATAAVLFYEARRQRARAAGD